MPKIIEPKIMQGNGHLHISAKMRKGLNIKPGDVVQVELTDTAIIITKLEGDNYNGN